MAGHALFGGEMNANGEIPIPQSITMFKAAIEIPVSC